MQSRASLAFSRNQRLVDIADTARTRALKAWQAMDYDNLDDSWGDVGQAVTQQVTAAQLAAAKGSDRYTAQVATQTPGFTPAASAIVPEAFSSIDGQGRDVAGILYGAVTTTKKAIGAGLGRVRSMEAGATYLAAILKTVIADVARSADLTSSTGRGFTYYVRVCNGSACSRCAMLAGIRSGREAFLRHVSCQCSAVPASSKEAPKGIYSDPQEYFDSLTGPEQDRVFTKAGAEAIRDGADISKVVSARRAAKGIGWSTRGYELNPNSGRRLAKTTIGRRADGTPIQVYATREGTTARGAFFKQQKLFNTTTRKLGAQYTSTNRIRLMPEEIMRLSGGDLATEQAFLRDAGYLDYKPPAGVGYTNDWVLRILPQQKLADRKLVDAATKRHGFTLG